MLVHGFGTSSFLWRGVGPALAASGHTAFALDLRGYGESDRPEGVPEYGIGKSVGDMLALLDGLGIERADTNR